ncbi:MAG: hypothetical protein WAU41_14480 [Gaiellaceae bacterium]
MIAFTASAWTQVIVGFSIFVPVLVTAALAWFFLKGARNDPDEQFRNRIDAERRRAATAAKANRSDAS